MRALGPNIYYFIMDDFSEFEGTIQRQEGALSAGVLEKLLEKVTEEPKFQHLDFSKEVG